MKKYQTKKLVVYLCGITLLLICVGLVGWGINNMAIKIPAKQIFNISGDKVIDNDYDCVEIQENQTVYKNVVENTVSRTVYREVEEEVGGVKQKYVARFLTGYQESTWSEGFFHVQLGEVTETITLSVNDAYSLENLKIFMTKQEAWYYQNSKENTSLKCSLTVNFVTSKQEFETVELEVPTKIEGSSFFDSLSICTSRFAIDTALSSDTQIVAYMTNIVAFTIPPYGLVKPVIDSGFAGVFTTDYTLDFQYETIRMEGVTQRYGDGTNTVALRGNEFIRNTSLLGSEKVADVIAQNILETYKNGIEVAKVECLIGEYYEDTEDGDLKLSLNSENELPMTFRVGDVATPYSMEMQKIGEEIIVVDGENVTNNIYAPTEIPYSKYPNGKPKQFLITQCEIISDGLVRQKLTMRESVEMPNLILYFDTNTNIEIGMAGRNGDSGSYGLAYNWDIWLDGEYQGNYQNTTSATRVITLTNNKSGLHTVRMICKLEDKDYCARSVAFYGSASIGSYDKLTSAKGFGNAFNGTSAMPNFCYRYMFRGCTNLVNAPSLPATSLANYCYYYMFRGCTNLVNAPSLPATSLASYCYSSMFRDCTNLVNAPSLPATSLASYCYSYMFAGCTKLTEVRCHYASNLTYSYADSWLLSITTVGKLYSPNAVITYGKPTNWTAVAL